MNSMRIVMMMAVCATVFNVGADLDIEKNLSGYNSLEEGQIVLGTFPNSSKARFDHVWVQRMYTGFVGSILFNPLNIEGKIGCEMRVSNEFPRAKVTVQDQGQTRRLYFYPYLTEADFTYKYGDNSNPLFSITAGYFPIKYNENSRNLGEYLFRSGAYPQTLVTDFDFAATRLVGLNLSSSPITGLSLSVILNSNIEWQAIGDLNLSGLASYNLEDIFEIGAGVSQVSIVSADPMITDGDSASAGDEIKYVKSIKGTDTTIGLLTFRGTKVIATASLNPINLLKKTLGIDMDFFGKEDGKLYSEVAVLGVKDYPKTLDKGTDYSDINKRIPVMFGINWPTNQFASYCIIPEVMGYWLEKEKSEKIKTAAIWGSAGIALGVGSWLVDNLLHINSKPDLLSFEGEWFGSILPNDMGGVVLYDEPTPLPSDRASKYISDTTHKQYKDDNYKWSVYAKRTLAGHFQIIGQVASDHLRWFAQDWTRQEWQEAFRNPRQFYYRFKLAYMF